MPTLEPSKQNIVFIIPSLQTGGSQRVFLHLLKNFDRKLFSITLILIKKEGMLVDLLPTDIRIIDYNISRTFLAIPKILFELRKIKPDIVLTTLGHLNLLISLIIPFCSRKTLFVARESSIISLRLKDESNPGIFKFLFKTTYRRFDHFICQSNFMRDDLISNFPIEKSRITVINNPIDFSFVSDIENKPEKWEHNGRCLISVGQLRKEKGYDRLLDALKMIDVPFGYSIIGDGEIRPELEAVIADSSLRSKVRLLGTLTNPYGHIAQADCLLLGSYYEGIPNSLLEANAFGVPVIAWSSPGGHNEIIKNGINGWLINSAEELRDIIQSKSYLQLDRAKIIEDTRTRYDLSKIIPEYEALLIRLSGIKKKKTKITENK